ncbi:MAG TPA: HAD family hydrolase [Methylomirabilota bacterium]|nr:HAD family hydrolase [Methylomirabilota bacterium]
MIRLVTFDFWDTLVTDSPENLRAQRALRVEAIRRALHDARAPVSEVDAEDIHERSGLALAERFWSRNRDPSPAEQLRVVLDTREPGVAARLSPDAFGAALNAYISPVLAHPPDLSPGAERAVRELAARGVLLGIVSNTGRTPGVILRRVLERHGLLRHFGPIAYSDEIGVRKPEAEIFRVTLVTAGMKPTDALHVGDNPDADVVGARGIGMRAAHYTAGFRVPAANADLIVPDLEMLAEEVFRVAPTWAAG